MIKTRSHASRMRTALLLTGRLEKVLCMGDAVQGGRCCAGGGGGAMKGKGAVWGGGGCCAGREVLSTTESDITTLPLPLWTDRQV